MTPPNRPERRKEASWNSSASNATSPFMRHALVFNAVSLLTFLARVFLATRGLHLSIEFTGGTLVEARYAQAADIGKARHAIEGLNYGEVQVRTSAPRARRAGARAPARDGKQTRGGLKGLRRHVRGRGRRCPSEQFVDNKG